MAFRGSAGGRNPYDRSPYTRSPKRFDYCGEKGDSSWDCHRSRETNAVLVLDYVSYPMGGPATKRMLRPRPGSKSPSTKGEPIQRSRETNAVLDYPEYPTKGPATKKMLRPESPSKGDPLCAIEEPFLLSNVRKSSPGRSSKTMQELVFTDYPETADEEAVRRERLSRGRSSKALQDLVFTKYPLEDCALAEVKNQKGGLRKSSRGRSSKAMHDLVFTKYPLDADSD